MDSSLFAAGRVEMLAKHLLRIIGEIDRVIGGSQWEPVGRLRAGIQSVRESLPDGAVDEELKRLESGSQLSLVA